MPRIFLSYRRDDSAGYVGRIAERLTEAFGQGNVFRDLDDIHPGADFAAEISRNVAGCDVLLAIIGPRWLAAVDGDGGRRLDKPDDFVRIEIESALLRQVRVIPVLVQKADMPQASSLPESIRALAVYQASELSDKRWDYDMDELIVALGGTPRAGLHGFRRWGGVALIASLAAVLAMGVLYWQRDNGKVRKPTRDDRVASQELQRERRDPVAETLPNAHAATADITGRWAGSWEGPRGRAVRIQLDLQAQNQRLLGSVRYPTGVAAIRDGRIEGEQLVFATRHTPQFEESEVDISFVGKLSGDKIEFVMQRPTGADRFFATRVPIGETKP